MVPVLDTDDEFRQFGQLLVNDQHAEETIETCVGEMIVVPVGARRDDVCLYVFSI